METIKKQLTNIIFLRNTLGVSAIQQTFVFLACFLVICSILIAPPSFHITHQYYKLDFVRISFLVFIFTLLMRLRNTQGYAIGITATLSLFFLALIYKWQIADTYFLLGGLLPQSDALSYYGDAQRLLHGFDMAGAGAYRPIYSSFLAVLMKMTRSNLQIIIIVLVTCNALSTYWAALEIRQVLRSNFAPAVYLVLSYMFFRRFSGTLMTENLGFCLGNLALIFLIRGSFQKKITPILYGIFLLTIALNARAGAFFVLPVLAAWLGLVFWETKGFWRPFFLGLVIVLLGMSANLAIARLTSSYGSQTFSNYSYTLYGIASGNKSWEQAGIDHPNAGTNEIYSFAIQKIINHPSLFFSGVFAAYRDYFKSPNGAFSFLLLDGGRRDVANITLWLITLIAAGYAFIKRTQIELGICLAFLLGIFISLSLVPPADSVKMRAYAATIPLSNYVIAIGVAIPENLFKRGERLQTINTEKNNKYSPIVFSILLLAGCLVLPPIIKWIGEPFEPSTSISCQKNEELFSFSIAGGSTIRLASEIKNTYVPNIMLSQFKNQVAGPEQQMSEGEKPKFLNLTSGTNITIVGAATKAYEATANPSTIMLLSTGIPDQGFYTLCLSPSEDSYYYTSFANIGRAHVETDIVSIQSQETIRMAQISGLFFVLVLIFFPFFKAHDLSRKISLTAFAKSVALSAVLIFTLHNLGIVSIKWSQQILDARKIRYPNEGFLYKIEIETENINDTKFIDFPVNLYEDGILLTLPHEGQSMIDQHGKGRYIIKDNFLFFSSSDNSDPRANGKEYTLQWPARLSTQFQIAIYGVFLVGLFTTTYFPRLINIVTKRAHP